MATADLTSRRTSNSPAALVRRAAASLGIKASPRSAQEIGMDRGWTAMSPWGRVQRPSKRVTSPLNAYGGTDEASTWVYACVTMRAEALSGYAWWLHAKGDERTPIDRLDRSGDVQDLYGLLEEPNDEMHYFDFGEQIVTDLDLCGNSFWLLDQQNGLGQPGAIEWLMPGTVKIAINRQGKRIGYVYEPKGPGTDGLRIPYGLSEVMHFRYRNPLNRYYGMGKVEALLRAVDSDIAQSAHVIAFFDQGAHLSGVLTVPETMGEEEFERTKRQYEREFSDSQNAFRVLIAEGANAFTPITSGPQVLGVVDLRKLSKDEILSGFGVPEFLLGGTGDGGVYKMEEAQNIFYRAMIPLGRRYNARLTMDLASRYKVGSSTRARPMGFHVDPRQSDTPTSKTERARKLVGTGATIDDILDTAGLERKEWEGVTDQVMLPSGVVLLDKDGKITQLTPPKPPPNTAPAGGGDPNNQPGGDGNSGTGDTPPSNKPDENKTVSELLEEIVAPAVEDDHVGDLMPRQNSVLEAQLKAQEQIGEVSEDAARAIADAAGRGVGDHHARAVGMGEAKMLEDALREIFRAQRDRTIQTLAKYGSTDGAKLKAKPEHRRSDLTPESVFDLETEEQDIHQRLGSRGLVEHYDKLRPLALRVQLAVHAVVREGNRRSYSVAQLVNGVAGETFVGVMGLFDRLVDEEAAREADRAVRGDGSAE